MHTHSQIQALVQNGVHPQITFAQDCHDLEGYAEPGMKARVVAVSATEHNGLKLTVDFVPFEAHNKTFETANYYDKAGNPTLTAREVGCYKGTGTIFVGLGDGPECFTIDSDERSELFARFQASGTTGSYVAWLEDELLRREQVLAAF